MPLNCRAVNPWFKSNNVLIVWLLEFLTRVKISQRVGHNCSAWRSLPVPVLLCDMKGNASLKG
jgi:hypothetical protein